MSVSYSGSASYNTTSNLHLLTTNSNDAGSVKTYQNASVQYVSQLWVFMPSTSNIPYNYTYHVGDDNSNIKYIINGSNLQVILNNSQNVLTVTDIKPYITYNTSNLLAVNVLDSNIKVRLNSTALAKINTTSMPQGFAGTSYISVSSSNPITGNSNIVQHKVKDILYQATPSFENQVLFKQAIKVPKVVCTTITPVSYCNLPLLTSVSSASTSNIATSSAVKQAYDMAVVSSNGVASLSNAYYNSTTGAVATWSSNEVSSLSNTYYNSSTGATSAWSSNTAAYGSNTAADVSNAYYNSSTGATSTWSSNVAAYGSNTATWASNNLILTTGGSITGSLNVSGNIGIGTTTPSAKLDVNGAMYLNGASGNWPGYSVATKKEYIRFGTTDGAGGTDFARIYSEGANNEGKLVVAIQDDLSSTEAFIVRGEGYNGQTKDHLVVCNDGTIGIGKNNPTTALDVNGTVNATTYTGPTITNLTNISAFGSNAAAWASNNLLTKSGGSITYLNTDKIIMPSSANIIGSGWDYITNWTALGPNGGYVLRNNNAGGLEVYTGLSNTLGMQMTITSNGNTGLGTYTPDEKLTVAGNVKVLGSGAGAIGITLSNNNSPGIEVTNGASALDMGVSSITGGYSADANIGDAVIRNTTGKLFLQSGVNSSAICINTANYVGIGTKLPIAPLDVRGNAYIRGSGGFGSKNGIVSVQDSNMSREIKLTATSNHDSYIEFYPDLYFKRLSGGAVESSLPILFVGSNGNFGIGTSNTKARFSMIGFNGQYNLGPHTEVYTYADSNPVFQQLNYGHNNISLNFDSYFDGTSWRSAHSTNCYNIYKLDNNLLFNYATSSASTVGNAINWTTAMSINANGCIGVGTTSQGSTKMFVNGDFTATGYTTLLKGSAGAGSTHLPFTDGKNYIRGTTILADNGGNVGINTTNPGYNLDVKGSSYTNSLRVGTTADFTVTSMNALLQTVGPSSSRKVQFTISGSFPNDYQALITPVSQSGSYDDNFSVTVMSQSSSELKLSVYRTDANSGWGQNLQLHILIIGTAA